MSESTFFPTPPLQDQQVPFNLTDLDRECLSQTDEDFVPHDWQDLKKIVGKLIQSTHTDTEPIY